MDLSNISTPDLQALANQNYSGVSTQGLKEYLNQIAPVNAPGPSPAPTKAPSPGLASQLVGSVKDVASYPAAVVSGLGQGVAGLGNLVPAGVNEVARHTVGHNVMPYIPDPQSLNTMLNLPQHPLVQGVASYVPAVGASLVGGPEIAASEMGADSALPLTKYVSPAVKAMANPSVGRQIAAGAIYGAGTQPNNPLGGGALGAGINAVTGVAGNAVSAAAKPMAKAILGNVVEPLAKKAGAVLSTHPAVQAAADALQGARSQLAGLVDYNGSAQLAKSADKAEAPGGAFRYNPQSFVNSLGDIKNSYAQNAADAPGDYKPVLDKIDEEMNNPVSGFESAMNKNKAYNDLPSSWEQTNNSTAQKMQHLSGQLKGALTNNVAENAQQLPEGQDFLQHWRNQNQNYSNLQAFNSLPDGYKADGSLQLKYTRKLASAMKAGGALSPDIMKNYLPTSAKAGTQNMEHFANLIGEPTQGRQLLQQAYMAPATDAGQFNPDQALKLYSNLSHAQRQFLFNPGDQQMFDTALAAKAVGGKPSSGFGKVMTRGAMGLGGAMVGSLSHDPMIGMGIGGALGAGAPSLAKGIASPMATPARVATLINMAKHGIPVGPTVTGLQALANPGLSPVARR